MNGLQELRALAPAFGLLMAFSALLLALLARMVPSVPGPRWWAAASLLALAGLLAASFPSAVLDLLADTASLLALACLIEGMLRFAGRRSAWRWWTLGALLYLLCALWLRQAALPLDAAQLAPPAFALAWGGAAVVALLQARTGAHVVWTAIASCTAVAALAWALRAWQLWRPGSGPQVPPEVPMLWLMFLVCVLLLLLFLLAVILRLVEQLRRESVHDPLTGALDRRGFEQHTARLAALSASLGQSVAMLMVDIDRFRPLNEQHGKAVGDLALKSLGQLVLRAKRESDAFARLGGDEFCIVLPGTDVPGARVFADRLRRSFAAFEIDTGENFLSCTISIGVAYASADTLQAGRLDLVDLLHQADEALDEAKQAGRNRVRFFASAEVVSSRLDSRLFTSTIPQGEA